MLTNTVSPSKLQYHARIRIDFVSNKKMLWNMFSALILFTPLLFLSKGQKLKKCNKQPNNTKKSGVHILNKIASATEHTAC